MNFLMLREGDFRELFGGLQDGSEIFENFCHGVIWDCVSTFVGMVENINQIQDDYINECERDGKKEIRETDTHAKEEREWEWYQATENHNDPNNSRDWICNVEIPETPSFADAFEFIHALIIQDCIVDCFNIDFNEVFPYSIKCNIIFIRINTLLHFRYFYIINNLGVVTNTFQ